MKYKEFKKTLGKTLLFSTDMIYRYFPGFDKRRLYEWKKRGKILSLKRGWWVFSDYPQEKSFLYYCANNIYTPSYVSLYSALSRYGLIPETVITVLSITTKKTASYTSHQGTYRYTSIKKGLYRGYVQETVGGQTFLIAEPEKALCDLFYSDNLLCDNDAFEQLRINPFEFKETISIDCLVAYAKKYPKVTEERIHLFILFMNEY